MPYQVWLLAVLLSEFGAYALRPATLDDVWLPPASSQLAVRASGGSSKLEFLVNSTRGDIDPSRDIAVVGNGPLSEEHRQELVQFPAAKVFRMNAMNNLHNGEPVGHVCANACSQGWWGVTVLACPRVHDAEEILLFGNPDKAEASLADLRRKVGGQVMLGPPDGHNIDVEGTKYATNFPNGGFSIGFKAVRSFHDVVVHESPVTDHWHGDQDKVCAAPQTPRASSFLQEAAAEGERMDTTSLAFSESDMHALWAGEDWLSFTNKMETFLNYTSG
mmetsp:Transcript_32902/g.60207  ORF Transcript_32902/g.60207 Transcript_32902/m.60207 type:complete len:275 (+) Transcript_32902:95-919(+)